MLPSQCEVSIPSGRARRRRGSRDSITFAATVPLLGARLPIILEFLPSRNKKAPGLESRGFEMLRIAKRDHVICMTPKFLLLVVPPLASLILRAPDPGIVAFQPPGIATATRQLPPPRLLKRYFPTESVRTLGSSVSKTPSPSMSMKTCHPASPFSPVSF